MAQRETSRISGTLRLKLDRGIEYGRPIPHGDGAERYEPAHESITYNGKSMTRAQSQALGLSFEVIVWASLSTVWRLLRDAGLDRTCCARLGNGEPIDGDGLWVITCPSERDSNRLKRYVKLNLVKIMYRPGDPENVKPS